MKFLPTDNFVGKSKIDRDLLKTEEWDRAKKNSDMQAAQQIVEKKWSFRKTEKLREIIKNPDDYLLISQPSTSGTNVVPIAFASYLSKSLGVSFEVGEEHFKAGHSKEVKLMTNSERIFDRRIYSPHDGSDLKNVISNKKLIIVEDVLTTGGSVAEFARALKSSGGQVVSVVALMGDKRLALDQSTKTKLQESFNKKDIGIQADQLSDIVTRSQAGRIIQHVNQVRTESGKQKITRKIQGLLDQGTFENLGRDSNTPGNESSKRNDHDHEGVFERVKAWAVQRGGQSAKEIKNRFLSKNIMARINWPPFSREEQNRLLTRFNAGGIETIRFSKKDEIVQGHYLGAFDHQGVSVGAIQIGGAGDQKLTLVPYSSKLGSFENQEIRYDIGQNKVSGRLQKQLNMVMTKKKSGEAFSKTVTIELNGKKSIEDQKKDLANAMQKQLSLGSKRYEIKFEDLSQEQVKQQRLDKSLSQDRGVKR
jgi:hypothetical protein